MTSPRIAMVTEGTYPFAHGGVSTWCDQVVRGLPGHEFEILALTATGAERPVWELPANVTRLRAVPLWGPAPGGRIPRGRRHRRIAGVCEELLDVLMDPTPAAQQRFGDVLAAWARLGRVWDVERVLLERQRAERLLDAWVGHPMLGSAGGHLTPIRPTVADAALVTRLLAHALRPLQGDPPDADVVHLVANGIAGLVGLAAKWHRGTPVVLSEHGVYLRERYLAYSSSDYSWPVKSLVLRFYRLLTTAVYSEASIVAPGNLYNRRWENRLGAAESSIRTVYNGVDPDDFTQIDDEPAEPTVAWVGRVDPLKDVETLLRAFAHVVTAEPRARLRLFGGTPQGNEGYRDAMVALTRELGIADRVVFEGRVPSIHDAYAAGHVVVLTSISEGFPYTVIEAMSCGRATVSTDVGGVAEAVGDAGVIVPPRQPDAVAAAVLRLLRDDDERRRLGTLARSRVLSMFTLGRSLDAVRGVYSDAAAMREPVWSSQDVAAPSGPSQIHGGAVQAGEGRRGLSRRPVASEKSARAAS
jgi:glycosyltransferase involved in cell wall biosynthesis